MKVDPKYWDKKCEKRKKKKRKKEKEKEKEASQ